MRALLLVFLSSLLISSCKIKSNEFPETNTLINETTSSDSLTNANLSRYLTIYDDTIKYSESKLKLDTSLLVINCDDTILFHKVNRITNEVLRVCAHKKDNRHISYLLLNETRIEWGNRLGFPNEFIGKYLFSDVYRGGEIEGTITKFKFKLAGNQLQFTDSIPGGFYSEGYGTNEWFISNEGQPKILLFRGRNLQITDGKLFDQRALINLNRLDTILKLPKSNREAYHQIFIKNKLLLARQASHHHSYLELHDLKGLLKWEIQSDYIDKLMVDSEKDLIIVSGHFFSGKETIQGYFTAAYDFNTGEMKWSFPTTQAYSTQSLFSDCTISNLFRISGSVYGMIVGRHQFGDNINSNNKLILFNSEGQLYETIPLSDRNQNYSVVVYKKDDFEIVSNYETRRFKIKTPPDTSQNKKATPN